MAKAKKDYPKPKSKKTIKKNLMLIKSNEEKIAKFVKEYASRNS